MCAESPHVMEITAPYLDCTALSWFHYKRVARSPPAAHALGSESLRVKQSWCHAHAVECVRLWDLLFVLGAPGLRGPSLGL